MTPGGSSWYKYNADGLRTEKIAPGGTTTYVWESDRLVAQSDGTDELIFVYDINDEITGFIYDDEFYGYHKNLQGDVVGIYDENQQTVVEYTYDTWGKVVSTTGTLASTIGKINPIRYRSYYYDGETGWYYLQSRYYDPGVGRFLNADVPEIMFFTGVKLLGTNLFAYADNNPVRYIDPSGYAKVDRLKLLTIHAPYYPNALFYGFVNGYFVYKECTVIYKYDTQTKKIVSIKSVTSLLSAFGIISWTQTGKTCKISKNGKSCTINVSGYWVLGVNVKGFVIGYSKSDIWKFTLKV